MLRSWRCAWMQVEDLRLHGDVEGGGGLVGEQQRGAAGQRHGDHDALAHAAGQLVRVLVEALARARGCRRPPAGAARSPWRPRGSCPRWMRSGSAICLPIFMTGLSDVIGSWKIIAISAPQMSRRSLQAHGGELHALEAHGALRGSTLRRGSRPMIERERIVLPEPGLADDAERAAAVEREADAVDGPDDAERGLEEVRRFSTSSSGAVRRAAVSACRCGSARGCSSAAHPMASRMLNRSASTSPIRLMERMVRNSTSGRHQRDPPRPPASRSLPAKIILPHVGVGASTDEPEVGQRALGDDQEGQRR